MKHASSGGMLFGALLAGSLALGVARAGDHQLAGATSLPLAIPLAVGLSLFPRRRALVALPGPDELGYLGMHPQQGGLSEPSYEEEPPELDPDAPQEAIKEFGHFVVRDLHAIRREIESVADRSVDGAERLEAKVSRLQQGLDAAEMMIQVLSKRSIDRREQFNDVWLLIKDLDLALEGLKEHLNEQGDEHDGALVRITALEGRTSSLVAAMGALAGESSQATERLSGLETASEHHGKSLRQLDREVDLLEASLQDQLSREALVREQAIGELAQSLAGTIQHTNQTLSEVISAMSEAQRSQADRQSQAVEAIVSTLTLQDGTLRDLQRQALDTGRTVVEQRALGELLVSELSELEPRLDERVQQLRQADKNLKDQVRELESTLETRTESLTLQLTDLDDSLNQQLRQSQHGLKEQVRAVDQALSAQMRESDRLLAEQLAALQATFEATREDLTLELAMGDESLGAQLRLSQQSAADQIRALETSFETRLKEQSLKDRQVQDRLATEQNAASRSLSALGEVISAHGGQLSNLEGDLFALGGAFQASQLDVRQHSAALHALAERTDLVETTLESIAGAWDQQILDLQARDSAIEGALKGTMATVDSRLTHSIESLSGALEERVGQLSRRNREEIDQAVARLGERQEVQLNAVSQGVENRLGGFDRALLQGLEQMRENTDQQNERVVAITASQYQLGDRLKATEERHLELRRLAETGLDRHDRQILELASQVEQSTAVLTEQTIARLEAQQQVLASLNDEQVSLSQRLQHSESKANSQGEALQVLETALSSNAQVLAKGHQALRSDLVHLAEKADALGQQGDTLKNLLQLSRQAMSEELSAGMEELNAQFRAHQLEGRDILDHTQLVVATLDERIAAAVGAAMLVHAEAIAQEARANAQALTDTLEAKVSKAFSYQHNGLLATQKETVALRNALANRDLETMVLRETLGEVQGRLQQLANGYDGDMGRLRQEHQKMASRLQSMMAMVTRPTNVRSVGA